MYYQLSLSSGQKELKNEGCCIDLGLIGKIDEVREHLEYQEDFTYLNFWISFTHT